MTVLEAHHITKTYQEGTQETTVLRGISMDLHAGEVVTLEGPSGSGKTTLLQILGCILSPSGGELRIHQNPVEGHSAHLAAIRGHAPELEPMYRALADATAAVA